MTYSSHRNFSNITMYILNKDNQTLNNIDEDNVGISGNVFHLLIS
jgi:hypothetical protein